MKRFNFAILTCVLGVGGWVNLAAADDGDLKIDRAVIFSSGVAYFDYRADVTDDAVGKLNLRTEQINDVLKSLVVRDLGGGVINVVNYASLDPLERTLKSFRVDLTDRPSLSQILDRLRGESVEISGSRAAKGLIVGVDMRRVLPDDKQLLVEEQFLNVMTASGMVQVPLAGIENLKFTNEQVNQELQNALATLAAGASKDKKSVELHFKGKGKRTVEVGYLVEAPIWKTSYRLVADDKGELLLQGWANIDNATEEDWNDVKLSLVSGRPISFRMDLYTPLYVPRPIEQLELHASLRAPEFEGSLEALGYVGDEAEEFAEGAAAKRSVIQFDRARGGRSGGGGGGKDSGFGIANPAPATEALSGVKLGQTLLSTAAAVAVGEESGELFEYRIETPVSIPRKQSAMLPIVSTKVAGEKVSIYNPDNHAKFPLNGFYLTNNSKLFLMQGPMTVFEDEVYAGDARLPDVKPDEKRLIAYVLDLGMEVDVRQDPQVEEIVSLKIIKGTLQHSRRYVDSREYVIRNKDDKDRTVLIEQSYGDHWKLVQPKAPYERTASLSRFKVNVPAMKTVHEKVVIEHTADQAVVISQLAIDQVEFYLQAKTISPKVKEALQQYVAMRVELDRIAADRARAEGDIKTWVSDQARIRANLGTLDRTSDIYKKQLAKFGELESTIEASYEKTNKLKDQESAKQKELTDWLVNLSLE